MEVDFVRHPLIQQSTFDMISRFFLLLAKLHTFSDFSAQSHFVSINCRKKLQNNLLQSIIRFFLSKSNLHIIQIIFICTDTIDIFTYFNQINKHDLKREKKQSSQYV